MNILMKGGFTLVSVTVILFSLFSYSSADSGDNSLSAATFLADKGVIQSQTIPSKYKTTSNITRREMLKVMMNISGKDVSDTCNGDFTDLSSTDWGCKYAEAALRNNYIAANTSFRPNDNVTQIEALKMIMQAKGIQRDEATDWRRGYVTKANTEGLLETDFLNYDANSVRGWIFVTSARTYTDAPNFEVEEEEGLSPEDEELLNHFLNI